MMRALPSSGMQRRLGSGPAPWLLALVILAASAPRCALALQSCEVNGVAVSTSNGYTTAGKPGTMRCRDTDSGLLVREQHIENGKFMGLVRQYEDGKLQREYTDNEAGNRQGRFREFGANGQLLRDETYENGSAVGLSQSFYPAGPLRRVAWHLASSGEVASAEFTESGKLRSLRCADKPLLAPVADDAAWCGFSGPPAPVAFFSSRGAMIARNHLPPG